MASMRYSSSNSGLLKVLPATPLMFEKKVCTSTPSASMALMRSEGT